MQVGLTAGNDTAVWDPDARLSPMACLQWTSSGNSDSIYGCANTINGAGFAYNNINQIVGTWSHRFSQTWNTATEAWYMWENNVPGCSGLTQHARRPLPADRMRPDSRQHRGMGGRELHELAGHAAGLADAAQRVHGR